MKKNNNIYVHILVILLLVLSINYQGYSQTPSPTSLSYSSAGGSKNISVMYGETLTLNDYPGWLGVTASGSNYVTLTCAKNCGPAKSGTVKVTTGGGTFNIPVTQAAPTPTPPTIDYQPSDDYVCSGQTASFTVYATGAESYQWQRSTNGGASYSNISGETSATLTLPYSSTYNNNLFKCILEGCGANSETEGAKYSYLTTPAQPGAASRTYQDGRVNLTAPTPPQYVTYLWQDDANSTETAPGANGMARDMPMWFLDANGYYFLRSRNICGTWGPVYSEFVQVYDKPGMPGIPTKTYQDGKTILTATDTDTGNKYYWQTTTNGESTDNEGSIEVSGANTYTRYLRAQHTISGLWSDARMVDFEVYNKPETPQAPVLKYEDGKTTATLVAPGANEVYYWQTTPTGTETNVSGTAQVQTVNGTYEQYVRTYHSISGLWSNGTYVSIYVANDPEAPVVGRTEYKLNTTTVYLDAPAANTTHYWQTNDVETEITNSDNPRTFNVDGDNNYYIRTRNNITKRWSSAIQGVAYVGLNPEFPANENYVTKTSIRTEGVKTIEQTKGLSSNGKTMEVSYYNGLGGLKQSVAIDNSPAKGDVVQPVVYDQYGRQTIKLLPYVDSVNTNTGMPRSNPAYNDIVNLNAAYQAHAQYRFYNNASDLTIANSTHPFIKTVFDNSPLNRVIEQGAPGAQWQPGNRTVVNEITSNGTHEVIQFSVENNALVNTTGELSGGIYYYYSNELAGGISKDENWTSGQLHTAEEFKNKQGQVLLKRTYVKDETGAIEPVETYYVYDDFGLLRYVLPPEFMKQLTTVSPVSQTLLDNLAYQYKYDGRNRMTEKKLPGAEPVYMVYDQRDRLVVTQDGNMRYNADGSLKNQWLFTKYDVYNRPLMTGITTIVGDQATVQAAVNAHYNVQEPVYYESIGNTVHGYTNLTYPLVATESDYLTVSYYDSYNNLPIAEFPSVTYDMKSSALISGTYNTKIKGVVVGTKTKVLDGGNNWMKAVNYYDDKFRVIQTIADAWQGTVTGQDVLSTQYDFIGQVMSTEFKHGGAEAITINKRHEYDHVGRLRKVYHQVNGQQEILMSYIRYNELGEMIEKNLHSSDSDATLQTDFVQSMDYRYNIRGWLKSINNSTLSNNPATGNDDTNDLFGFEIMYNTPF